MTLSDSNDLPAKKDLNSWNKSSKHLSSNFLNLNRESEEEQCDLKKSKSANNSTLSLHIAAYENSVEDKADSKSKSEKTALIKKWNNTKQGFIDSLSFAQNPFEFPRQQEEQSNPPEVMQFKASQRLRNPNKEHLNFDKKSDKVAPLQPNHRPKSVDIQPIHCALRDSEFIALY
uniref:Uncharacterized protein n=1 Tax=Panagrolaimus superbus TaxID=310955 RepID=A0A914YUB3_9BILA